MNRLSRELINTSRELISLTPSYIEDEIRKNE